MATDITAPEAQELDIPTGDLRVDLLIDSKHKFTRSTPRVTEVEHDGRTIRLMLPSHCPACDFVAKADGDDWLFLIGRQKAQEDEGYGGAIVIARRQEDDLYTAELWHETYGSFMMRASCMQFCPELSL